MHEVDTILHIQIQAMQTELDYMNRERAYRDEETSSLFGLLPRRCGCRRCGVCVRDVQIMYEEVV
jgi:hypothetical protein